MKVPELERFRGKVLRMREFDVYPNDARFNALYWISDCLFLSYQIEYSVDEMENRAQEFRHHVRPGDRPSNSDVRLSYFTDNAIVRLLAFREKLGLSLLSYFCVFDSRERAPNFAEIVRSLDSGPLGQLRGAEQAAKILGGIRTVPRVLKRYRDSKIHRREPRIEFYGIQPHHDGPYYVPVADSSWTESIAGEIGFRALSSDENPRLFAYQHLLKSFKGFRRQCYVAADEAASFLKRREPFKEVASHV